MMLGEGNAGAGLFSADSGTQPDKLVMVEGDMIIIDDDVGLWSLSLKEQGDFGLLKKGAMLSLVALLPVLLLMLTGTCEGSFVNVVVISMSDWAGLVAATLTS